MIKRSADISPCGTWRYELRRIWNPPLPPMLVVMLNPSTADGKHDDPTIRTIWKRAAHSGHGELIVGNLGAGRSYNPHVWKRMPDPIGPLNNEVLEALLREARERYATVVVGWGAHGNFMQRDDWFLDTARKVGVTLYCLGHTLHRFPRHPLYVAESKELEVYRKEAVM